MLRGSSTYTWPMVTGSCRPRTAPIYQCVRRPLELRRHHLPPRHRGQGGQDQARTTPEMGQAEGRLLFPFDNGPPAALDGLGRPNCPLIRQRDALVAEHGQAKADWMRSATSATSALSELVPDGPVLVPASRLPLRRSPSTRRRSRSTASRRSGGHASPRPPHLPVRGLLQRLRHGDARRHRGVPAPPSAAMPAAPLPNGTTSPAAPSSGSGPDEGRAIGLEPAALRRPHR